MHTASSLPAGNTVGWQFSGILSGLMPLSGLACHLKWESLNNPQAGSVPCKPSHPDPLRWGNGHTNWNGSDTTNTVVTIRIMIIRTSHSTMKKKWDGWVGEARRRSGGAAQLRLLYPQLLAGPPPTGHIRPHLIDQNRERKEGHSTVAISPQPSPHLHPLSAVLASQTAGNSLWKQIYLLWVQYE